MMMEFILSLSLNHKPFYLCAKLTTMKKTYSALLCIAILLISSCGGANTSQDNTPAAKPAETGDAIYGRTCVACHLATGEGVPNTFPPLAKSDYLSNKENVIHQVLKGSSGELVVNGNKYNNTMPPQQLSDEEIASVLSYVYSHFGNSGPAVSADEVKQVRGKL
jgi:nitrite reductase (NO-forming)